MKKIGFVLTTGIVLHNMKDLWMSKKKRNMSVGIQKSTLTKILEAPINLFFDVTPIGKVLSIFNDDMNVFRGEIIDPLSYCMDMLSHVVVVTTFMVSLGSWEVFFGFAIMGFLAVKIATPYLHADN